MSQFRIDYIILNAGLLGSCFLRRVEFTDPRKGGQGSYHGKREGGGREREKKEEEEKEREVMQVVQFFMPSSMSPTLCGFIVCLIKRQGTFPFLLSLSLSL